MLRDGDKAIQFMNQDFILAPEKAIYWKEKKALLLADLHLGKSGHFQKAGIPVSSEVNSENLSRLQLITDHFKPKVIYYLGDLFHSAMNAEWREFKLWKNKNPEVLMKLILGNHDFYAIPEYENFGLKCFHELEVNPFILIHDIPDKIQLEDKVFIGGHIHPSIRFKGKGRQSLRASCFCFSENKILLPAFGSFTGTHNIKSSKKDMVFPILEGSVASLSNLI